MSLEEIKKIKAIDVHSHFGEWNITRGLEEAQKYMPGGTDFLQKNMSLANIGISISSHLKTLSPRGGGDALAGNETCLKQLENEDGLIYVGSCESMAEGVLRAGGAHAEAPEMSGDQNPSRRTCLPHSQVRRRNL